MKISIEIVKRYGYPTPMVDIQAPKGTTFRALRAKALRLAADIEEASGPDKWCVTIDNVSDSCARIYLETASGELPEASRGYELLRVVVGR